jgi:hypothetical protein
VLGPAISNDDIARRLGFEQLRLGYHRGPGLPEWLRINAFWVLTACPTFAAGWKAGALAVEDVTGGVPTFAHRCLAFFATDELVESAEVPGDPAEVLAGIDPFEASFPERHRMGDGRWKEGHSLDGISYELEWETEAVRWGRFRFGNPRTAPLIALERRLFDLVSRVHEVRGSAQVAEYLDLWWGYVSRRAPAEPGAADRPREGR